MTGFASDEELRPAGPVAGHGPSSSQAAGEGADPAPPAGGSDQGTADASGGGRLADEGSGGGRLADEGSGPGEGSAEGSGEGSPLAEVEAQRDEYLDLARRTQADFENFRKRMAAEVGAAGTRGKAAVVSAVVPALDDLERAILAAGLDPEGDSEDGLAHGVLLVFRNLRETLGRCGVEAVDPVGERFDPNLHEALSTQPVEGAEPGHVVEVMQKGYRLDEQLIRPARVVVAQ